MLLIGVLYLGEYQNSIIETKLMNFEREVKIISLAVSELDLSKQGAGEKILRMIDNQNQHIKIFDKNGRLLINKEANVEHHSLRKELASVKILKDTAAFITSFLPENRAIPPYPESAVQNTSLTPDLKEAISGLISISIWQDEHEELLLSAGAPIVENNKIVGAVIIIREGQDIKEAVGEVWQNILKIFVITLLVTIILSIYLAGAIANPLKKLATAAEAVRKGQATGDDIPDLSHRLDEIGDLSVVLRSMTDALWEKMDSIESFAADVSHELKNPLTSLKSAIETLQKVKNKSDQEKLLDIIDHDIQRMDRLITDISSASRIDAELSRETFKIIALDDVIKNLLEHYKNPIDREDTSKANANIIETTDGKIIHFKTNDSKSFNIKGAPERLQHVFQNLIDNALSFSKSGDTVHIEINRGENLIAVHIDDQGPGIPNNKLQSIFERFYTERPAESYGQNSGLGLSICKQIIESHRGEIFAENRLNEKTESIGARFNVILKAQGNG